MEIPMGVWYHNLRDFTCSILSQQHNIPLIFLFLPGYVDVVKSKHIPKDGVLWTTLLYGTGPGYDWGLRSNRTKEELGTNLTHPHPPREGVGGWGDGYKEPKIRNFREGGIR